MMSMCRRYFEADHSGTACVWIYKGDLACEADLAGFCEYIREQVSTVDILVHSAGAYCCRNGLRDTG